MVNSALFDTSKTPVKLGALSIICYVLDNNKHVINLNSLQKALGYDGKFENWLFEFLNDIYIFTPFDKTILEAFEDPIHIINFENKDTTIKVLSSELLIETCKVIIQAKSQGFLNQSQLKFSKRAQLILDKIINVNLDDLIDQTIGYEIFKDNILEKNAVYFVRQYNDPAFLWAKTFPHPFWEIISEMNNMGWNDMKYQPQQIGEILNDIIFSRISDEDIEELRLIKPKRSYKRKNNKKQEHQHPKLKEFIAVLSSLAVLSGNNWIIFLQLLNKTFPKQKNSIQMNYTKTVNKKETLYTDFNEKLKNSLKNIKK